MKKLLLTFVFAMAIGAISSFAIGDEEEFDIILEETSERGTRGGTTPLECAYIVDLSLLRVNCLEDVGTVTVSVRNTSTGDVITDSFNSVSGQAFIPVSNDSGTYILSIITGTGKYYRGVYQL